MYRTENNEKNILCTAYEVLRVSAVNSDILALHTSRMSRRVAITPEEREEMEEYYREPEEESTIGSMLDSVFKETSATEPGPPKKVIKLDEETFEPIPAEGMMVSCPTDAELEKYPELEYTTEEVQAVVSKMSREQLREFQQYEQYYLTRYRQTGNMVPLHMEVRRLVGEMCPAMPGQLQEAIVEARAQLLAELRLKELCRKMGLPLPKKPVPPMIHPIDEGLMGTEAATPMSAGLTTEKIREQQEITGTDQPGVKRIRPVAVPSEADIDVKPSLMMPFQLMSDATLKAMEGAGDESCRIIKVTRGRDPNYDLAKGDQELEEALGLLPEDVIPTEEPEEEVEGDDLSIATMDSLGRVNHKEAAAILTRLADAKAKEAEALQDLTALIQAEEMGPEQVSDIVQAVVSQEATIPEMALVTEVYDYEATKMILAAGVRMRQIYDANMKRGEVESLETISQRFKVSKTRLFEMLKGKKLSRAKTSLREAELRLDTEGDVRLLDEEQAIQHADELEKIPVVGKAGPSASQQ